MDIRALQLIGLTAIGQSLSQAAETLGISQPTATKLIRSLEEDVGGDLYYRGKRPIQLTPLGRSIAEQAAPLVDGIKQLIPMPPQAELNQPIVIAATSEIFAHVLADVLGRFHNAYPDVRVSIREGFPEVSYELVARGQAHLMLGGKPPQRLRLRYEPLGVVRRVVLTPPSHPLTQVKRLSFSELAKWPIILTGRDRSSPASISLLSGFKRQGLSAQIAFEVVNVDSMKRFVAMGFGIGAGPAYVVESSDFEKLSAIPANSLFPIREMGLAILPNKPLPPQAASLLEMIIREVPAWLEQVQAFAA